MAATRKAKRAKSGPYECSEWNGRVVLTRVHRSDLGDCYPTTDIYDRAHDRKSSFGEFFPAAFYDKIRREHRIDKGIDSEPRRYHISQLVGWRWRVVADGAVVEGGVGLDSSFDEWHELRKVLEQQGIPLGGLGRASAAMCDAEADVRLRDMFKQQDARSTVQSGLTKAELWAERAASAMLDERGDEHLYDAHHVCPE